MRLRIMRARLHRTRATRERTAHEHVVLAASAVNSRRATSHGEGSKTTSGTSPRAAPTTMPKLKLALVGCGRICEVAHFPGILQHCADLVEVTACVDINLERAKHMASKVPGGSCATFASLEVALEKGGDLFDAVDLMLLHTDHEAASKACFDAGKHVLMVRSSPAAYTPSACTPRPWLHAHARHVQPQPPRSACAGEAHGNVRCRV